MKKKHRVLWFLPANKFERTLLWKRWNSHHFPYGNQGFPRSLRHAAKKYGIEIEEDQVEYSEEQKKAQSEREILYKIHEVANNFFQENLWETEEGKTIASLFQRNVNCMMTSSKISIAGYSPEKKNALQNTL